MPTIAAAHEDNTRLRAHAVVVLPAVGGGRLGDVALRRWLARAELSIAGPVRAPLARILDVLGRPQPAGAHAALRLWGRTGRRPTGWIAAADPVYLEPRLDHLRLHALGDDSVTPAELRTLFEHLQATLAPAGGVRFSAHGAQGYLRAGEPVATAAEPPAALDGGTPGDFLPSGASASRFRNLLGEIEMALHEHAVNLEREATGRLPVNSLWLWGGGTAPRTSPAGLPPLFADEPLCRGFWYSLSGDLAAWPGTIAACLDRAAGGFVAIAPDDAQAPAGLAEHLDALRAALSTGRLKRVTLLFADGLHARVLHRHRLRFWRREPTHLGAAS